MKRLFKVYLIGKGDGCYAEEYREVFLGETWAVSESRAILNIHYRLKQKGERLPDNLHDSHGMGSVRYEMKAVAV